MKNDINKKVSAIPLLKKVKFTVITLLVLFFILELISRIGGYVKEGRFWVPPKELRSPFFNIVTGFLVPYRDGEYYVFGKGERIKVEKPGNTIRIICFGGSTTVNLEAGISYSEDLKDRLESSYPDYDFEVLNAGGDAYSTAHTLVNFALRTISLKPDIITVYQGFNDLCVKYFGDYVESDYSNEYLRFSHLAVPPGISGAIIRYSRVMSVTVFKMGMLEYLFRKKFFPNTKGFPVDDLFIRNIRSIIAIAEAHGIVPIIGIQANIKPEKDFVELNSKLKEYLIENNVLYADVFKEVDKDEYFYGDEIHYTKEGVQMVAKSFLKPIKKAVDKIIDNDTPAH